MNAGVCCSERGGGKRVTKKSAEGYARRQTRPEFEIGQKRKKRRKIRKEFPIPRTEKTLYRKNIFTHERIEKEKEV